MMAESLAKNNYEVHVFCMRDIGVEKETINGVTVWSYPKNGERNIFKLLWRYMHYIHECVPQIKPHFIQVFSPELIPLGTQLRGEYNSKLVYDCYEYWIGGALTAHRLHSALLYLLIESIYLKHIDGAIFVYDKNPTMSKVREDTVIELIYNIPKSENIPQLVDPDLRKSLFGASDFVIGCLGLVMRYKGYESILRALTALDDNFKLLIIGDALDPLYKDSITQYITDHGLSDRVHFTGIVPYKRALEYASVIDVGLVLFDDASWTKYSTPNKLFEYMSLGIPIIATDLPNLSNIIDTYKCGVSVPVSNIQKLCETLRYLKDNPRERNALSLNGKNAFYINFNEEKQLSKLLDLYRSL
jgi:glycosyltransferase involved in cell wall biosynthesis